MVKLTVAIPSYNNEENLKRCLTSCKFLKLEQNDFEILIVDNASTDNTISIIKEFQSTFNNIRLIQNEKNIGRIENWNKCLEYSKGKYLIFIFTNDEIHEENNIQELLSILDDNNKISITVSPFVVKHENKEFLRLKFSENQFKCSSHDLVKKCIDRSMFPFGLLSLVFRTDEIKKLPKFPVSLPGNTDQVFSTIHAVTREFILFNTKPQMKWNLTKKRHHFQINPDEPLNGHVEAHNMISKQIDYNSQGKYLLSYYLIKSAYYLRNNRAKFSPFIKFVFSQMRTNFSSFGIDPIFIKSVFKKIGNQCDYLHELYLKEIINSCTVEDLSDNINTQ